jgi:RHS repeat-associated protein
MIVALVSSDQFFGSRRLAVMDQLGSVGTYYPWGENRGGTNPQDTWSFGTYWTDSVTGLDYANNRYYFNSLGRFMTPDPYQASGGPSYPQSWNRCAYVMGDPVNYNDPPGTTTCDANGDNCFDGVTVNGDTGEVTWSDMSFGLAPVSQGGYFGSSSAYQQAVSQWNGFGSAFAQAYALAGSCPFGESVMSNGKCDIAINQTALQVFSLMNLYNPAGFINAFGASMVAGVGSAILAGSMTTALADASWALATNGNTIVLGSFPGYLELADKLGADTLNLPDKTWTWAENVAFLEAAIANGSDIIVSTNADDAKVGTYFYQEIQWLLSHGCTTGPGGWSIICH